MKEKQILQLAEDLTNLVPYFHQKFIQHLQFPVPPNHFCTLFCLHTYGTQTITEISNRLLISKQQMSPIVEKLLKSGYIERQVNPADKRSAKITMTKQGYQLFKKHHNEEKAFWAEKIKTLDNVEHTELEQLLSSFYRLIDRLS